MDGEEWMLDICAIPIPVSGFPELGEVHAGFSIGAFSAVDDYIIPTLKSLGNPQFYLGGHSKGSAQAGQAHGKLKLLGHTPLATYLFEPPFFGGQQLADLMKSDNVIWTETYNSYHSDAITAVPFGPTWKRSCDPIRLKVPDDADRATMHKMPAVLTAIKQLVTPIS